MSVYGWRPSYVKGNPYGSLGPSPGTVGRITPKRTTSKQTAVKPPAMSAEQWAREQAERYIQAQIDSINQNRDLYLEDLKKQSQLEAERGLALSQALQALNIPGRIQQIYGNASADIGGLAQAFSGSLKDQALADTAEQTRMVAGTGQEGAVRNQGENMGNVSYGLSGYIPARSMGEAGAAFASQAALEPSFAARIGQEKAADVHREGLSGLDEFTQAINEVRGERFGIEQELLSGRREELAAGQKSALAAQDAAYKRLKDQRDFYVKQQYLALAQGNSARSDHYAKLATERETRMREHESRMAAQARGVDADGNPLPGFERGADGTIQKTPKPPAKGSSRDPAVKRSKARQEREDEFRKARLDAIDEAKRLITPATTLRPEQRPSYQVAYSRLWNRYKDLLRFAGTGGQKALRARIDKLIREALAQNGFAKPVKTPRRSTSGPNSAYR